MPELMKAFAINHVFPEGMKTTAFVLEYDREFTAEEISISDFTVLDHSYEPKVSCQERTVRRVYTNNIPALSEKDRKGQFIIIETDLSETAAFAIGTFKMDGKFDPFSSGAFGFQDPKKPAGPPKKPSGPPKGPGPDMGYCGFKPLKVEIIQNRAIPTEEGTVLNPGSIACTESICPETEKFRKEIYEGLPYNLYIPEDYDPQKKYPAVLFIPDAGGRGNDIEVPLVQGIGGLIWASREDQKKHPCFVVCPAFGPDEILTHDDFTFEKTMYKAKDILDEICRKYSIDTDRIYTTGQSMGCMSSCQLMNEWPDYFAGAVLVAGQWSPERCGRTMNRQNLWILVSSNDLKAHPGMDAVTKAIEENGGRVLRTHWDASKPVDEQNVCARKAVQEADRQNCNVIYTVFDDSSVVPEGQDDGPGSNHVNTWRVAYQIPEVRDWLFTRSRRNN